MLGCPQATKAGDIDDIPGVDADQRARNAIFAAAVSPDVVMRLVAEGRRLQTIVADPAVALYLARKNAPAEVPRGDDGGHCVPMVNVFLTPGGVEPEEWKAKR